MAKRVLAWVLLIGFILLLLNIMVFHFYIVESVAVYLIVALWFLFSGKSFLGRNSRKSPQSEKEE